jgi:hypothetical protein
MRFVNSTRGSDDSEASTLMSDQTVTDSLCNDTPSSLKHHTSRGRGTVLEYERGASCSGLQNPKQLQSTMVDSKTLKFKTERHV